MPNPIQSTFPFAAPSDASLTVASDNAVTTIINSAISANQTTMDVYSITGFELPCVLVVDNELMLVTGAGGNTFTGLVRGFGGSTATTHALNATVSNLITSFHFNKLAAEIKALGAWVFNRDLSGLRTIENQIQFSEAFENTTWNKWNGATIIASGLAPDGGSARLLRGGNTMGVQKVSILPGALTPGNHVWSAYVKYNTCQWMAMGQGVAASAPGQDSGGYAWFDVENGAVGTVSSAVISGITQPTKAAIVPLVNGWFRLLVMAPTAITGNVNFELALTPSDGVLSFAPGSGTSAYVWGAQVAAGNLTAPLPYVKTNGVVVNQIVSA